MPVICKIWLIILCYLPAFAAQAQKKTFSFSAGMGLSYVSKKKINSDYSPAPGMNISASLMIPVSDKIFVETGIGYRRKGFKGYSVLVSDDQSDHFHTHARYDYLSIPLAVAYTIRKTQKSRLWIGGGMNYSFLLQGRTDIHQDSYHNDWLMGSYDYSFKPRIGLVQSKRKEIALFLFDAGLKLQVGYLYRNRWLLQVFHEHSLYSFVANAHDGSSLKLRYTGISVGIVFP